MIRKETLKFTQSEINKFKKANETNEKALERYASSRGYLNGNYDVGIRRQSIIITELP